MDFHIRPADIEDSEAIAHIQVDSYRAAYAAILPKDYLANFTYEEQAQDWQQWPVLHPQDILLVAENDAGELVGYALGRPGLTTIAPYDCEMLALHIRASYQDQGVGRQLTSALATRFRQQGCSLLLVWVLEQNPARAFYERLGGQFVGQQQIELGEDIRAVEVAYGWPDMASLGSL